jgi:hypothetical protein
MKKPKPAKPGWGLASVRKSDGDKWYLAEKINKRRMADGKFHVELIGRVIDVTEPIQRDITGNASYIHRLENALERLAREVFRLRGMTPTDYELGKLFDSMAMKEKEWETYFRQQWVKHE